MWMKARFQGLGGGELPSNGLMADRDVPLDEVCIFTPGLILKGLHF